ncbi:MAG: hypothetical protein IJC76_02040 [Lachnospiraceae bacterium]|nr:hypothetical protein [Lachnospiraceae bacterium]
MEIVKTTEDIKSVVNNTIESGKIELINSTITFCGEGNILVLEDGVKLVNSNIRFESDNSLIYLSSCYWGYSLEIQIYKNCVCSFGKNNYINARMSLIIGEGMNFFCGKESLFAREVKIRTSDHHLIYDIDSMKRINYGKSVYLGDHIWLADGCRIFKGSMIGSGSIIGAGATITNKVIGSNEMWAGTKRIKKKVCFLSASPLKDYGAELEKYDELDNNKYIYSEEGQIISFTDIEEKLQVMNVNDKKQYIKELYQNTSKNLFYIKSL